MFVARSVRFLLVLSLSSILSGAYQQQKSTSQQEEPTAAEPYSFSYSAQSIGGFSSHQESGDGSGRVTGFYTIQGEDGRERRVDYVADENGYRASVQTNEVGTRTGKSADADYLVQLPSAGQLEAAKVSFEQYQQLEEAHANEQARIQNRQSTSLRSANQQQRDGSSSSLAPFNRQQVSSTSQRSAPLVNSRNSTIPTNSRQSRQPDTRDLAPIQNSLESQRQQPQQRSTWQTRASVNGDELGRGSPYARQQLELQFQQQANQLTDQDYPRQQPAAFENTSQFLIDEAQSQDLPPQPQLQSQLQPLQPQPQPQWQQQTLPHPRPQPQVELINHSTQIGSNQQASLVGQSGSYGQYQQQQDNIINEPMDVETPGHVDQSEEVLKQPQLEQTIQQIEKPQPQKPLQPQRQTQTINYNENLQTSFNQSAGPSGFISISLDNKNSDNQSEKDNQDNQEIVSLTNATKQTSDISGYGIAAYGDNQQEMQTGGEQDYSEQLAINKQVLIGQPQQSQQEVANSVNQIIENFSRQPERSENQSGFVQLTGRPETTKSVSEFQQKGSIVDRPQIQFQRQPVRSNINQSVAVRPTLAPTSSPVIVRQTTTLTPATTSQDYTSEDQTATVTGATAQSTYTTPDRFYQPITTTVRTIVASAITTTTTTPAPTTARPIQLAATSRPLQVQQQKQLSGIKRAGSASGQNSPLAAMFRKNRIQQQTGSQLHQAAFISANNKQTGFAPDKVLITTTRAPIRLPVASSAPGPSSLAPIQLNTVQDPQQTGLANNQQQQRFISEAPYSIYSTEQPISSVSYAIRNKTSSSAPLANQQQRFNQQPNNSSIRFNQTTETLSRRPLIEQHQTSAKLTDSQVYQPNLPISGRPIGQPQVQQQQNQQWKGIKGGRVRGAAGGTGKQFWQSRNSGNQTGRFQVTSTTAIAADDYATSMGYGSRVTAPAINLTG